MPDTTPEVRQLEALLDFYLAAGVDASLTDEVVDWEKWSVQQASARRQLQAGHAPSSGAVTNPQQPRSSEPQVSMPRSDMSRTTPQVRNEPASTQVSPPSAGPKAIVPDQEIVSAARERASQARSLDELRACLENFDGCNLRLTAKSLVFGDGNPQANLMFVGEAPGRDEDLQGLPFVGRSGQLLDRMLEAIGRDRSSAYIANVVPWRPPGNRTPTPQETEICKPFIQRQIELVKPDVLVFLGAASAKTLLGTQDGIRKMRGRWMQYALPDRQIEAVATYHPAYLLRSPLEKRLAWRDFLAIKARCSDAR